MKGSKRIKIFDAITDKISGEWGDEVDEGFGVKVLRTTNFTNDGILNLENVVERKIKPELVAKKKLIAGDVIIEKSGGSPNQPVGRVVYFNESGTDYLCNNFTAILRPGKEVYPKYFFYALFYLHLSKGTLRYQNKTTGILNLKLERYLEEETIPLPDLKTQQEIAHVLEQADKARQQRKAANALTDEFLQSSFLSLFGDPVKNEKGWEVRKLEELYSTKKEGTKCGPFGSALKKGEYIKAGIPVWVMDNIQDGKFLEKGCLYISEEKYKELNSYSIENGDIIISRAGTVGKMCMVNSSYSRSIISTNLIRLSLNDEKLLPVVFVSLMTYFGSRVGKLRTGTDGAFTHMNTGVLNNLRIPLPPHFLQQQFAAIVAEAEALRKKQQESEQELEQLFQSLLQLYFG